MRIVLSVIVSHLLRLTYTALLPNHILIRKTVLAQVEAIDATNAPMGGSAHPNRLKLNTLTVDWVGLATIAHLDYSAFHRITKSLVSQKILPSAQDQLRSRVVIVHRTHWRRV